MARWVYKGAQRVLSEALRQRPFVQGKGSGHPAAFRPFGFPTASHAGVVLPVSTQGVKFSVSNRKNEANTKNSR